MFTYPFKKTMVARRSIQAFTLIELLVSISIISLLIAILLPTLSLARAAAQTTMCLSQMRQNGLAFHMYAEDYNEKLSVIVGSVPYSYLLNHNNYNTSIQSFFCPSLAPGQDVKSATSLYSNWTRPDGITNFIHGSTYGIRWAHPQYNVSGTYRFIQMPHVPQPSNSMILTDTCNRGSYQVFRVAPDTSTWSQIDFRHQSASGMLFLDGRAANTSLEAFRSLGPTEALYWWNGQSEQLIQ